MPMRRVGLSWLCLRSLESPGINSGGGAQDVAVTEAMRSSALGGRARGLSFISPGAL